MASQITALPTPPNRADPSTFSAKGDAFLGALPTFGTECNTLATEVESNLDLSQQAVTDTTTLKNDVISLKNTTEGYKNSSFTYRNEAEAFAASALSSPGTLATSATSLSVSEGVKSFTIQAAKSLVQGQFVIISYTTSVDNFMIGQITSYNSSTGAIVVDVSYYEGSGSYASWNVALSAPFSSTTGSNSFTASGSIPALGPVFLNSDGTVSAPDYVAANYGSAVISSVDGTQSYLSSCWDSTNNKLIVVYRTSTATLLKAVVGTVSGTGITFGTPASIGSDSGNYTSCCYDPVNQRVVVFYDTSPNVKAIVGTVSGDTISFGTAVVISANGMTDAQQLSSCFDSQHSKINVFIKNSTTSLRYTIGTVSGSSISFTALADVNTGDIVKISCCYDSVNQKTILHYNILAMGYSRTSTSTGTALTFGAALSFAESIGPNSINYISSGRYALTSAGNGLTPNITVTCLNLSGTALVVETSLVYTPAVSGYITNVSFAAKYNSSLGMLVVSFNSSSTGQIIAFDITGTTPVKMNDSYYIYIAGSSAYLSLEYDPVGGSSIVSYIDGSNSKSTSRALVLRTRTNAANFIGFSQNTSTVASTGRVNVKTLGGIDTHRIGLTTNSNYYVDYECNLTTGITDYGVVGRATATDAVLVTRGFK